MTDLDRVLQRLYEAALAADDQDTGSIDAFRDARAALTPGLAVLLMAENERLVKDLHITQTMYQADLDERVKIERENERLREALRETRELLAAGEVDNALHALDAFLVLEGDE